MDTAQPAEGLRIVCLSDTHGHHASLDVPPADVLVHAGDFALRGNAREIGDFAEWIDAQPHAHKVVVAGNHDRLLEEHPCEGRKLLRGVDYLQDSGLVVAGLRFWGSPWQPEYGGWAFNLPPGAPLAARWSEMPEELDVLVTHCPPRGILDRIHSGLEIGCPELSSAVERRSIGLHVFGHAHEGAGVLQRDGTWYANAASCDLHYRPVHAPLVFERRAGAFTMLPRA